MGVYSRMTNLSLSLLDLTKMLTREASLQGCAVYGILIDSRKDVAYPFIMFTNVSERGAEMVRLLRETADLVEKKVQMDLITSERVVDN